MGHFFLSRKNTPRTDQTPRPRPPPYRDSNQSPLIVTETTTTRTEEVTATTQTTHFLSFPAWGKRSNNNGTGLRRPRTASSIEGTEGRASFSQRNKELPPTPSDSPLLAPLPPVTTSNRHQDGSQSITSLAQSLSGLGYLQHALPQTSGLSTLPKNEVNTVAFVPTSFQSQPVSESSLNVRRAKSSHRLGVSSHLPSPEKETERRTRGVSLLGFTASDAKVDPKGKERVWEPASEQSKPLTRKSSFWNRKRDYSQPRPLTAHGDFSHLHNSYEVNLSDLPPPPTPTQKLQARNHLSHSFSERPQSRYPIVSPDTPVSPPSSPRRPATAGGPVPTAEHDPLTSCLTPGSMRTTAVSFSGASEQTRLPRPRSQTNPPLLHRLSLNVFSSSSLLTASPTSSPSSPLPSATSDPYRRPVIIPRPMGNEESPDIYLGRLMDVVSKAEATSILASSVEPFYAAALEIFIGRFNFVGDSLDIALRKLLLEIGLPKETQQIDRVMEAFSKRYIQCNPDLYVSDDHPYILAFSLIMLHTDAFNKSNRRKMTKSDYIKNTSLPGVETEILEYFYDNIIFAPFIFIEDPLDFNGQHGLIPESNRRSAVFRDTPSLNSGLASAGPTLAIKTHKIDPYYMISNDLLGPLRVDPESFISLSDPFSYKGTAEKWDEEELLRAFANAHVVEVGGECVRSSTFFGLPAGSSSNPLITAQPTSHDVYPDSEGDLTLRVTKAGIMDRKDELGEGGKKPLSRKWKPWGVLLTGSQLLFSRDPSWMYALIPKTEEGNNGQVLLPSSAILKVDELLSVKNAIAVLDKSYTKHRFAFRLVLSDGRHLLLKASSEDDMNQWISRINYASAFKTAGVRMQLLSMSGRSMELTGVAAATSHLHDLQNQNHLPSADSAEWDENAPRALFEMLSGDSPVKKRPSFQRKVTLRTNREEVELEAPVPVGVEKTPEFRDAFDQVKADLAAESCLQMGNGFDTALALAIPTTPTGDLGPHARPSFEVHSQASSSSDHPRLLSRSQIIEAKIADLDNRLITTKRHLDTHIRFIRNVATLVPFQKATRDRLIIALQTRARNVMQLRLDMARMQCHRNVLQDDMLAENRIWKEVKDTALKVAKETLQTRQIPEPGQSPQRLKRLQSQKSESSICESFHTAIDFGPDWPSDELGSSLLVASRVPESPRPSTSGSFSSYRYDDSSSRIWKDEPAFAAGSQDDHNVMLNGGDVNMQHEKYYTAQESPVEEAEEWNKTRCAKRVSLVRVPSTLDFLPMNKRLTLTLSATAETKS